MSDLPRRRLLAAAGAALTGTVAGCASDDGNEGDPDAEPEEPAGDGQPDGTDGDTALGEITVDNLDDASHAVDVLVEFDGAIESWATEELEGDSGATLERDWPSDPGAFRVTTRLDHGDPVRVTPANWNEPSCLNLFVRIDRDGELTVLGDTSGGPCGTGDATDDATE